jgi:nucleoside 2-deoxyribosyltransferase
VSKCFICGLQEGHEALLIDEAPKARSIYLIGSMRNARVQAVAKTLREAGFDVFDDWASPGPETDDRWQEYEKQRGRTFREALAGHHAQHAFALDRAHLERCDLAVLVAPAGKSGHLELGWVLGQGKPGYILMDGEPERYDLMYLFATAIFMSVDEMLERLK